MNTRVLNQDEIDLLLGFDAEKDRLDREETILREENITVKYAWDQYVAVVGAYHKVMEIVSSEEYILRQYPEIAQLKDLVEKMDKRYKATLKLSRKNV